MSPIARIPAPQIQVSRATEATVHRTRAAAGLA